MISRLVYADGETFERHTDRCEGELRREAETWPRTIFGFGEIRRPLRIEGLRLPPTPPSPRWENARHIHVFPVPE